MYCAYTGRNKYKVHPRTGREGSDEKEKYGSDISSTSTLDGVWWSKPYSDSFIPGKDNRHQFYERPVGPTSNLDGCE